MKQKIELELSVPGTLKDERLDKALAVMLPDYSRSLIKSWIDNHAITVDGQLIKPRVKLTGGEKICINTELEPQTFLAPEDIKLDIRFEDEHLLIINKPAGLVVHPGAGNPGKTLVNALLFREPTLENLPRAGLIHRLDKDTSGLLLVAKTQIAHTHLVRLLQDRDINRHYVAIVQGRVISGGTIEAPIGRHPIHRLRMAVTADGKNAVTHYRVLRQFRSYTYLSLKLETGRTHQIRVHLAHQKFPIVGDPLYSRRRQIPKGSTPELTAAIDHFQRQALHAIKLDFIHPITEEKIDISAELPQDFQQLLQVLHDFNAA